jgi:hypothetical protein
LHRFETIDLLETVQLATAVHAQHSVRDEDSSSTDGRHSGVFAHHHGQAVATGEPALPALKAVKYCSGGEVTISIHLEERKDEHDGDGSNVDAQQSPPHHYHHHHHHHREQFKQCVHGSWSYRPKYNNCSNGR